MAAISDRDDESCIKRSGPSLIEQLEYIPLISTIVGVVRIVFGAIQTVFGIFTWPFELVIPSDSSELLLIKGLANMLRGSVASVFIVGNIALYLYDRCRRI